MSYNNNNNCFERVFKWMSELPFHSSAFLDFGERWWCHCNSADWRLNRRGWISTFTVGSFVSNNWRCCSWCWSGYFTSTKQNNFNRVNGWRTEMCEIVFWRTNLSCLGDNETVVGRTEIFVHWVQWPFERILFDFISISWTSIERNIRRCCLIFCEVSLITHHKTLQTKESVDC
jgi:hypothetical protein